VLILPGQSFFDANGADVSCKGIDDMMAPVVRHRSPRRNTPSTSGRHKDRFTDPIHGLESLDSGPQLLPVEPTPEQFHLGFRAYGLPTGAVVDVLVVGIAVTTRSRSPRA
jgi:hypothetical protein